MKLTALATPEHTCGLGRCYAEIDAKLAVAQALVNGDPVKPEVWQCTRCECFHIGERLKVIKRCPDTGKRIFTTRTSAARELEHTEYLQAMGVAHRKECRVYECPTRSKDGRKHWHLTSDKEPQC